MSLLGSGVSNPNYVLRFCGIVFIGIIGLGVALSWRESLLLASEYQDLPVTHQEIRIKKANKKLQLKNKLIQSEDIIE